ncbi:hypothetical protein ABW21_db0209250 [Orbilia brochopaga]|nr:hypothetical protein ABW21_db0209250 [Drechslerella brochopaga]
MPPTTLSLWDVTSGSRQEVLEGAGPAIFGFVNSLSFSPDGRWLAAGTNDQFIRVWSLPGGKLTHVLGREAGYTNNVTFFPDSKQLAFRAKEGQVRVWTVGSDERISDITSNIYVKSLAALSLVVSPDGKNIAFGVTRINTSHHDDFGAAPRVVTEIEVWEVSSKVKRKAFGLENFRKIIDRSSRDIIIHSIAFSPDSSKIALAIASDCSIVIEDIASGSIAIEMSVPELESKSTPFLLFLQDGKHLASGWDWGGIQIWDVSSGSNLHSFRIEPWTFCLLSIDLRQGVSLSYNDMFVNVTDLQSASSGDSTRIEKPEILGSYGRTLSPDGKRIAWAPGLVEGSRGNSLYISDISKDYGPAQPRVLLGREMHTRGSELAARRRKFIFHADLAFFPDGRFLIKWGKERDLEIWDTISGLMLDRIDAEFDCGHHSVSADGKLVTALKTEVTLWKISVESSVKTSEPTTLSTPQSEAQELKVVYEKSCLQMTDEVECVALSTDSSVLAIGMLKTIEVWGVGSGVILSHIFTLNIERRYGHLVGLAVSHDGGHLAALLGSHAVVFDAQTGAELKRLKTRGYPITPSFIEGSRLLQMESEILDLNTSEVMFSMLNDWLEYRGHNILATPGEYTRKTFEVRGGVMAICHFHFYIIIDISALASEMRDIEEHTISSERSELESDIE